MENRSSLERFVERVGLASEAAALLMIVIGVLIIVFPDLVAWIVGLLLVLVGVVQLVVHVDARRHRAPQPASPPPPPT